MKLPLNPTFTVFENKLAGTEKYICSVLIIYTAAFDRNKLVNDDDNGRKHFASEKKPLDLEWG